MGIERKGRLWHTRGHEVNLPKSLSLQILEGLMVGAFRDGMILDGLCRIDASPKTGCFK